MADTCARLDELIAELAELVAEYNATRLALDASLGEVRAA
jgi:hypothetical protein